ncbi:MAG TPA: asparagine synthase (glutamine-hydrolyzing), partial [Solirubrobacterales bacterium]
MCGICGVVAGEREGAPDLEAVSRMCGRLVHRGPDDDGLFHEGPVALAARRLSIIDLDGGHQPIANEDGSAVVIQNGEIYNYRELKRELEGRGHRFATDCDTEVLVHLYEEHGEAFVERLRGMFAIALWDKRRQRLLLARDRFGIKPLYYREAGGGLSFASELKAMIEQPGFSREIDPKAVSAYLAFNSIPAPLTIFTEARKLPPGYLLTWVGGVVRQRRYARPGPQPGVELRRGSASALADELRAVLDDSVRAHLVADVPVGVLLSGGVDSGGLAALASAHLGEPLRTFSIGFEEAGFNELARARLVAERYGTDHHELVVRPDAVELLPKLVETFDEPFGDSSALPTYLVSQLASEHVKTALSGEGGDELFGGYYTYVADLLARRVGRLAPLARPLAEALPSRTERVGFDYKAKRFARAAALPPLERHHAWKEIFSPRARAELAGAKASSWDPVDLYRARYAETAGAEPLARMQDVDLGIYLVDDLLVKTDRLSMAHSLELRVPFLDPKVAEFAFSLPTRFKVRGFAKKRLLRQALEPLLPKEIVHGRKQGFSIP